MHFIVILEEIFHGFIDKSKLYLKLIVNFSPHPGKKTVHVSTSLYFHTFRTIAEIVITIFLVKFTAPFGEDAENGWAFDAYIAAVDLDL